MNCIKYIAGKMFLYTVSKACNLYCTVIHRTNGYFNKI